MLNGVTDKALVLDFIQIQVYETCHYKAFDTRQNVNMSTVIGVVFTRNAGGNSCETDGHRVNCTEIALLLLLLLLLLLSSSSSSSLSISLVCVRYPNRSERRLLTLTSAPILSAITRN